MIIERPLDLLNSCKEQMVEVKFKDNRDSITGILKAFDIHINLVIQQGKANMFLRGDNILSVEKS